MSNSSPVPVLRGSRGTVLRFTGDALTWSRDAEEVSIPLQAIAHVRTEGRTVTVRLVAPVGSAPVVHRVDGVSRAAAGLFVPAVNAALPERTEEDGTVDGSTLVSAHNVPDAEDNPRERMMIRIGVGIGVVSVLSALAVGLLGQWAGALVIVLFAPLGLGVAVFGVLILHMAYLDWYLPRYGITVEVERAEVYSHSGSAVYTWTDPHGRTRGISGKVTTETAPLAYHPSDADKFTLCASPLKVAGDMSLGLVVLLVGLGILAGVAFVTWLTFAA
ncbi:hypothetical protein AB0M64_33440 [Streptomyces sp. NPDC051771]|uniref:hypothetical protein n=1 Tax=Streptomyces sp. NPDC051771 TaxID=3154847 RepID=UPI003444283E